MKFFFFESIVPSYFLGASIASPFYKSLAKVTNIDHADICFNPIGYEYVHNYPDELVLSNTGVSKADVRSVFYEIIENAKSANKKVIILYYGDPESDLPFDNAVYFRSSYGKSKQKGNVFSLPAWNHIEKNSDFLSLYFQNKIQLNEWSDLPSVGFRGAAATYNFKDKLKLFIKNRMEISHKAFDLGWPLAYQLRTQVITDLKKDKRIKSDMHIAYDKSGINALAQSDYKKKYINNLCENTYGLCVRGFGNYSYRFYELLSCGRIPVFFDTDCILPYDFIVDYKKHCVWIDERDMQYAGDIIIDFHYRNKADFKDIQMANRRLWEEYLSPKGFSDHFILHF